MELKFLIFRKMEPRTFKPKPKKNKKINHEKNSLYFRKWNFLALIFKKFLYFFKRKLFLYFRKWNPALFTPSSKNKRNPPREGLFSYFRKRKPRNGNSTNASYISGGNLQNPKNKKVCFEEMCCQL